MPEIVLAVLSRLGRTVFDTHLPVLSRFMSKNHLAVLARRYCPVLKAFTQAGLMLRGFCVWKNERLFIISFLSFFILATAYPHVVEVFTVAVKRNLSGRKYPMKSEWIECGDVVYRLNQGASGLHAPILRRFIDELHKAIGKWKRVFCLRFDLHHTGITRPDNLWASRFIKSLRRRVVRRYGCTDLGYLWVREHERGKAQHYHAVVLLDGDVIRYPSAINEMIDAVWSRINPVNTVFHPENQFYFVDCEKKERDVVYRVSYMAKARGKGYRPPQTNDYYGSSLPWSDVGTYCHA